jgi:GT2 family glycosyltransferase
VAVVIPSFKVKSQILKVVSEIGSDVNKIIVVDDACPEGSGKYVSSICSDSRLEVLFNEVNLGVGGAVKKGYERALELNCDIVIKLDGDGQMDPRLVSNFILPIVNFGADYVTGNRFWNINSLKGMPKERIIGNLVLSLLAKASTGYWGLFDINNGYTAIRSTTLKNLDLGKIDNRYFFESDILFRLNLLDAKVFQIPMDSVYRNEKSNLRVFRIIPSFLFKHLRNVCKRVFYSYFLRDFSIASLNLFLGFILLTFSVVRGLQSWIHSIGTGIPTSTGTQFLVAISFLTGIQLFLSFLNFDYNKSISKRG